MDQNKQLIGEADEKQLDTNRTYGELMTNEGLDELSVWANGIGPSKTWIIPETVAPNGSIITGDPTDVITRAHQRNLLVHPYTFRSDPYFLYGMFDNNPYLEYQTFFDLGVDGVFSDFPDTARLVRDCMFFPPDVSSEDDDESDESDGDESDDDDESSDFWGTFTFVASIVLVAFVCISLLAAVIGIGVFVYRRKRSKAVFITDYDDLFQTA